MSRMVLLSSSVIRSPTRPHYKEEEYIQTKVVLKYAGHTDYRTDRNTGEGCSCNNTGQMT